MGLPLDFFKFFSYIYIKFLVLYFCFNTGDSTKFPKPNLMRRVKEGIKRKKVLKEQTRCQSLNRLLPNFLNTKGKLFVELTFYIPKKRKFYR